MQAWRRQTGILLLLVSLITGTATADRVTFEDYLKMDEETKRKAAAKHVKREEGYYVLSYGNYVVRSNVDAMHALKLTVLMDDFYHRFSTVFSGKFKRDHDPEVYAFADKGAYQTALAGFNIPAGWSDGMYVHRKKALFAHGSYGEEALHEILFHEGTHQLVHSYFGSDVPIWFNEGLATNFECWGLTRSHENNIANAIYVGDRLRGVASTYPNRGFVPFRRLITITSREWSASMNPLPNYASAWITVYFFTTCEDGRKFLNLLTRAFRRGDDQDDVIDAKLAERAEARLAEFIEQRVLPNLEMGRQINQLATGGKYEQAARLAGQMQERYPESEEAEFFSAWLSLHQGEPDAAAVRKALDRLLELEDDEDYDHPEMDFALAEAYARLARWEEAEEHAERAAEGNLRHTRARELLARAESKAEVMETGEEVLELIEKRHLKTAYERAQALHEEHPENPVAAFLAVWLSVTQENLTGEALTGAIEELRAFETRKDFHHPQLYFALAQSYAKAGEWEPAARYAGLALEEQPEHETAKRLRAYAQKKLAPAE